MTAEGTVEIGNGTWNCIAGTYSVAGTTVLSGANGTANFNAAASNNTSEQHGGGVSNLVLATFPATTTITNSTISGNSVTDAGGYGAGIQNFTDPHAPLPQLT